MLERVLTTQLDSESPSSLGEGSWEDSESLSNTFASQEGEEVRGDKFPGAGSDISENILSTWAAEEFVSISYLFFSVLNFALPDGSLAEGPDPAVKPADGFAEDVGEPGGDGEVLALLALPFPLVFLGPVVEVEAGFIFS